MKAWMSMAAVAALVGGVGHARLATASAEARPLDSGRYGVETACEPKATFLECGVSIRDLVYDAILVNQKLSFTPGDIERSNDEIQQTRHGKNGASQLNAGCWADNSRGGRA